MLKLRFFVLVLAITAVVRSTPADKERVCSVKVDDGEEMHSEIAGMAKHCLVEEARLSNLQTLEEFQAYSKQYCGRRAHYQTCLDDVTLRSEFCQNETQHQIFLVLKELMETTLEIVCQEEGDLLTTILHGYHTFPDNGREDKSVRKCVTDANTRFTLPVENDDFEPATNILVLYREILSLKECVNEHIDVNSDFWHSLDIFLGGIIKTMKCVHPRENIRLPCNTIVIGGEEGLTYCPVVREEGDLQPMKLLIAEHVQKCIMRDFPEDDKFIDNSALKVYIDYYKELCQKRRTIEICMHTAILTSSVCLNDTEHQVIKLVTDILRNGLENGCMNEGEPLAFVTKTVLRDVNDTDGHKDRLNPCQEIAKMALDTTHSENTSTKRMELYTGMREFRDCFISKLDGETWAVFYAQFMFNQVLKQFRCMNPENGAKVFCQTLDTTSHSGSKACILNTETNSDPVPYFMFINMGFTCINMKHDHFGDVDAMTTLGEYNIFYGKYCESATVIEDCLSDVTAISEACLTAVEHQMLRIFTDMLVDFLKTGCKGEGETMASFALSLRNYDGVLKHCVTAAHDRYYDMDRNQGNSTSVSIESFGIMKDFVLCFSNSIPDGEDLRAESVAFLALLLKRFQCVGLDGALVPCETILNDAHGK